MWKSNVMFAKEETLLESHLVIRDSAISMFSSIRDSEKVRLGEAGGIITVLEGEGEGEGDLKNTFLIPLLGINKYHKSFLFFFLCFVAE